MDNSPVTLNNLLSMKDVDEEEIMALVESEQFKPVREGISKALKGIPVPKDFFKKLIDQVSELLDIDVYAILLSAWCASGELRKYLEKNEYAPDEVVLVPLGEHTITSSHKPSLKPSIKKIPLKKIDFGLEINLAVKGVILKIKNGRIMEITIGSCDLSGELKMEGIKLTEKKGGIPELLGSFDLGEGIPVNEQGSKIHKALDVLKKSRKILKNPEKAA